MHQDHDLLEDECLRVDIRNQKGSWRLFLNSYFYSMQHSRVGSCCDYPITRFGKLHKWLPFME